MNLTCKRIPITLMLLILFSVCHAQSVIIRSDIKLPKDSIVKKLLISSLNGFLAQKDKPNKDNSFVLKDDLLETSALLDELKGMDKNLKLKDNNFYKCYLGNVVPHGDNNYIIQISYIGVAEGKPDLRASFTLQAKKRDSVFYFSSPLKRNTLTWKTKKMGNVTYHFKDTLAQADAKKYLETVNFYDKKLDIPIRPISFYYCDGLPEALQITGIDYKADYNGSTGDNLSSHTSEEGLVVGGGKVYQYCFDTHDLWHERLRYVVNTDVVNRPVDEGCAYLYGGSWGVSWPEVLARFKQYAANNPNADWLASYTESTKFEDDEKPMYIAYALNALIVQKVEKEKGFKPVLELAGCGHREKGDDNYFKALEKLTGITKANFNAKMWELLKAAK
ncbi:MAG: hypothetical protein ACHQHN_03610 [Sphingobacteriales bacterium]